MDALSHGKSGVLSVCQPKRCDTGPAEKLEGWGDFVTGTIYQVTLMENRKVLHSACEHTGPTTTRQQHTAHNNSLSPQPV